MEAAAGRDEPGGSGHHHDRVAAALRLQLPGLQERHLLLEGQEAVRTPRPQVQQ